MIRANEKLMHVPVLIVGAGPAGLAAAITLKKNNPDLDVCVLDKAMEPGNHNLSGAVLDERPLAELLDPVLPDWRSSDDAKTVLSRKVMQDNVYLFLGKNFKISMMPAIQAAKLLHLGFGQMVHAGDTIVSISQLTRWLSRVAQKLGVELMYGFSAAKINYDALTGLATGVTLADQGLDKHGQKQQNYVAGETITADAVILAEGCLGLLTEEFVQKAGLRRKSHALFSVGVKEIIEVSPEQYQRFGDNRVVHAMGYPIWTPLVGPGMFGGGILYSMGENRIAVGRIIGPDWKSAEFNPLDPRGRFKYHAIIKSFIEGGTVVEAGAKMIPEGGFHAISRDPQSNAVGKGNVAILGDSAGFVNMLKIKGLHNAIESGMLAGRAAGQYVNSPEKIASEYTKLLDGSNVYREMWSARNFRQTVAKFGNSVGMPLSTLGGLLPAFEVEPDYKAMTPAHYPLRNEKPFDKDAFTAMAKVQHREEQPCHCEVRDPNICETRCKEKYGSVCLESLGRPCVTFCPAGVYEMIQGRMKAANPSNCLHCKTCQNKCPYDNLRWHIPEGSGGPRYRSM